MDVAGEYPKERSDSISELARGVTSISFGPSGHEGNPLSVSQART